MKTAWITLNTKAESDENQFHVRESWSDGKAFEDHLNTPHLKESTTSTNDRLSAPMQATILKKVEHVDNKQAIEKLYQAQCNSNQLVDREAKQTMQESKDYIGMWVTADGYILHHLLPENRYDEARGKRESAYRGSYKVTGNHIDYKDDTGFTADGDFRDGILYHAGMVLYKQK